MNVLIYLIPVSLFMGGIGLAGFFWMLKHGQFDDPEGDANRILSPDHDDEPMA
ncbi:MAG: cbb3-type cytochrome oxidase assembly protein CcoS [Paracoccaceae bacterium]